VHVSQKARSMVGVRKVPTVHVVHVLSRWRSVHVLVQNSPALQDVLQVAHWARLEIDLNVFAGQFSQTGVDVAEQVVLSWLCCPAGHVIVQAVHIIDPGKLLYLPTLQAMHLLSAARDAQPLSISVPAEQLTVQLVQLPFSPVALKLPTAQGAQTVSDVGEHWVCTKLAAPHWVQGRQGLLSAAIL
jgi:hypothetical protein